MVQNHSTQPNSARLEYQYVNAKNTFNKLDWWVLNRIFIWARKKHGRPPWRVITSKYKHRDPKGRLKFVYHLEDGSPIWLYRMGDRPILRYWIDWQRPGYTDGLMTTIEDAPTELINPISYPAQETDQVRLLAYDEIVILARTAKMPLPPYKSTTLFRNNTMGKIN